MLAANASVRAVRGSIAEHSTGGGPGKPVVVGTVLYAGAIVRTGPETIVDLFLKQNGPIVRVTPGSELELTKLQFQQTDEEATIETALTLKRGRILGIVKKLSARSRYEVAIPVGSARILSGQYDISAEGQITALSGVIVFKTAAATAVLSGGQSYPAGANVSPPAIKRKRLFGSP
jgi:hypothetical protein